MYPISLEMRTTIILCCILWSFISCNDSKKDNNNESARNILIDSTNIPETSTTDRPVRTRENKPQSNPQDSILNGESQDNLEKKELSGVYYNIEHLDDNTCKCYCIDVSLDTSSELCLKEGELYIQANYRQNGNVVNIYYAGRSNRTTSTDIPWDKFATGTPIAVLVSGSDGSLELDWKGFTIDNKLAVEYALYGKKTLEGIYKKKKS